MGLFSGMFGSEVLTDLKVAIQDGCSKKHFSLLRIASVTCLRFRICSFKTGFDEELTYYWACMAH